MGVSTIKRKWARFIKPAVLIIFSPLLLLGCDKGKTAGEVIVGTEATYPPFEMFDEAGNITGFDIELLKAIGKEEAINFAFKDAAFDSLIPALQAGHYDLLASAISITEERQKQVLFSAPYIETGLVVAVSSQNTSINSLSDIDNSVVAVQLGTTGENEAEKLKAKGVIKTVKTFPNISLAILELLNGGADAVINDKPSTEQYLRKRPGEIRILNTVLRSDAYGFATTKDNQALIGKINSGLKKIQSNGTLEQLKNKYFNN